MSQFHKHIFRPESSLVEGDEGSCVRQSDRLLRSHVVPLY